jgi:phage major head subunit gpT-like protein
VVVVGSGPLARGVACHARAQRGLEINENQHQYGVKAIHEAGYGFWQDPCLVTFS